MTCEVLHLYRCSTHTHTVFRTCVSQTPLLASSGLTGWAHANKKRMNIILHFSALFQFCFMKDLETQPLVLYFGTRATEQMRCDLASKYFVCTGFRHPGFVELQICIFNSIQKSSMVVTHITARHIYLNTSRNLYQKWQTAFPDPNFVSHLTAYLHTMKETNSSA